MITFYQGNSVDMLVTAYKDEALYAITNDKMWFTIKTDFTDPDSAALVQVTAANGITILDGPNGSAQISLTAVQTEFLPTGVSLHCDVQIRTPAGKVYTLWVDTVVVSPKVTQSLTY